MLVLVLEKVVTMFLEVKLLQWSAVRFRKLTLYYQRSQKWQIIEYIITNSLCERRKDCFYVTFYEHHRKNFEKLFVLNKNFEKSFVKTDGLVSIAYSCSTVKSPW